MFTFVTSGRTKTIGGVCRVKVVHILTFHYVWSVDIYTDANIYSEYSVCFLSQDTFTDLDICRQFLYKIHP